MDPRKKRLTKSRMADRGKSPAPPTPSQTSSSQKTRPAPLPTQPAANTRSRSEPPRAVASAPKSPTTSPNGPTPSAAKCPPASPGPTVSTEQQKRHHQQILFEKQRQHVVNNQKQQPPPSHHGHNNHSPITDESGYSSGGYGSDRGYHADYDSEGASVSGDDYVMPVTSPFPQRQFSMPQGTQSPAPMDYSRGGSYGMGGRQMPGVGTQSPASPLDYPRGGSYGMGGRQMPGYPTASTPGQPRVPITSIDQGGYMDMSGRRVSGGSSHPYETLPARPPSLGRRPSVDYRRRRGSSSSSCSSDQDVMSSVGQQIDGMSLAEMTVLRRAIDNSISNATTTDNGHLPPTEDLYTRIYDEIPLRCGTDGRGMRSNQLVQDIIPLCAQVAVGPPAEYKMPIRELARFDKIKLRVCEFGEPSPMMMEAKTITVVGETGSGKSTMVDFIVNYIYGVEYDDDVRLKIVDVMDEEMGKNEVASQTEWITCYTMHHYPAMRVPFTVNLIDAPGFGDTRGMYKDQELMKRCNEIFQTTDQHGLTCLDAVCFLVQGSTARLTPTQRYIFDSTLAIWGKDLEQNIFVFCSFCDNKKPIVLKALNNAQVPYSAYHIFNNSCLISTSDDMLGKTYWDIGCRSLDDFFDSLHYCPTKSLVLSGEVMKERQDLDSSVKGLQSLIQQGLSKMDTLQRTKTILEKEPELTDEAFTFNVPVTKKIKVEDKKGVSINCKSCLNTCFPKCSVLDTTLMGLRRKMDPIIKSTCSVCKCRTKEHTTDKGHFELKEIIETVTVKHLKDTYENMRKENKTLVECIMSEFRDVQVKVAQQLDRMNRCINRLHTIALRPQQLSMGNYLHIMVEREETEGEPGFERRVTMLKEMQRQFDVIQSVTEGGFNPWKHVELFSTPDEIAAKAEAKKGKPRPQQAPPTGAQQAPSTGAPRAPSSGPPRTPGVAAGTRTLTKATSSGGKPTASTPTSSKGGKGKSDVPNKETRL